jgi:mono/diheme cytochrome c family protein
MLLRSVVWFATAAALAAASPSLNGDATRGAALFQSKNCVTCHSVAGQGAKTAPDLGRRGGSGFTPVSLAAMLWNHAPHMWRALAQSSAKVDLTPQDSADMFAYFYAARYMDPPGDAGRGKKLFRAKGCADCHALDGASGNKRGMKWEALADPIELGRQMWNHAPAMRAEIEKKGGKLPTLTAAEMNDMLVYLSALPQAKDIKPVFQPASAETGEMLFNAKGCADCHKGARTLAKRVAFRTVSDFSASMWNHAALMKQSGELRPEEMKRLVGYVWSLQFSAESGDTERGAKVFAAKACGSCHTSGPGPKIAGAVPDAYTLIGSLTQHAPGMIQKMDASKKAWPSIKDGEMEDLLAYLKNGK